jgi:hypothetical protein
MWGMLIGSEVSAVRSREFGGGVVFLVSVVLGY